MISIATRHDIRLPGGHCSLYWCDDDSSINVFDCDDNGVSVYDIKQEQILMMIRNVFCAKRAIDPSKLCPSELKNLRDLKDYFQALEIPETTAMA